MMEEVATAATAVVDACHVRSLIRVDEVHEDVCLQLHLSIMLSLAISGLAPSSSATHFRSMAQEMVTSLVANVCRMRCHTTTSAAIGFSREVYEVSLKVCSSWTFAEELTQQ